MHTLTKFSWLGALAIGAALPVHAQDAAQRGLEIAQEADRRDTGWSDSVVDLTMTLRNKNGDESVREMRSRALEVEDDGDKSMIIFDQPRDVRGTALLTYSHKTGDDDQWLYLPALKRVKRIASSNKSGPFMGSEFAYEDLSSQEVEKYTYNFLREEELDGEKVFVIERFPTDENSGYTKQVAWLDQAEYRVRKIEFYDRKNSHLKTLTMHEFDEYLDEYWRPGRMEMVNHQTGKSTTLTFANYAFQEGLDDRDFDQSALKRAR
ncbi:outer membrane lipoprotein-sorting protein [uncultured Abyssibacter sp.]|uniref:outer membrane lipoprotein-sorting protein n=1 Tax=uncultured Abyssibacter sp. TaxID=2320202 RepID=UPI0032B1C846